MKVKCFYALLLLFVVGTAKAVNDAPLPFTIEAEIVGLIPGDTLCFKQIELPGWNRTPAFDVVVSEPDRFNYTAEVFPCARYYSMSYKPLSGEEVVANKIGLILILGEGTVKIKGKVETIYFSSLEGGIYDDPILREIDSIEYILGVEGSAVMKERAKAAAAGDTAKEAELRDEYAALFEKYKDEHEKRALLEKEYLEYYPSSVWTLVYLLGRSSDAPLEELQTLFQQMDSEARGSCYGVRLEEKIKSREKLLPGNDAPDFNLTTITGERISLKDFAGSYLLIYHWGLCPGSIMNDMMITKFCEEYKEHLKVVGLTDNLNSIREHYDKTPPGELFMNVELKPVFESMLVHPWPDSETSLGDNGQIMRDYDIAGLPYFVFISPDGKIIAKGYYDALTKGTETIEAEYPKE